MITQTAFAAVRLPGTSRTATGYVATWTVREMAFSARSAIADSPPYRVVPRGMLPDVEERRAAWKKAKADGWRIIKVTMTAKLSWEL
ncbi:MAG: hypothetical protein WD871_01670 [Xanthobacteraceae bacterium]